MKTGRLEIKTDLRQVLAPEMLQLLKLLQLPTLELEQLVRQELEQNPFLEEAAEEPSSAEEEAAFPMAEEPTLDDKIDWQDYLQEGAEAGDQNTESAPEVTGFPVIPWRQSLQDILTMQLRIVGDQEEIVRVGETIIGDLDRDGFLKIPLEEISKQAGCSSEEAEQALRLVQSLDPPGIGARDLRESLLLQLSRQGLEGSLAWEMVSSCFDLLERQRLSAIARALKTTAEEVARAQQIIAGLSPRPGSLLDSEEPRFVYPDVIIEKNGDRYQIVTNDRIVPRVRLASGYQQILRQTKKARPEEREFVAKRLEAARFMVRMIEQRRRTLTRILEAVVRRQKDFLDNGVRDLKPMTMGQVADDIGVHESTVSRAVQNKYALTPQGIIPLRMFFASGLKGSQSEDTSAGIKARIADLIATEDPKRPLTDDQIARALKKQGIDIARRTVAKYREEEKIMPARLRRRPLKPKD